MDRVVPPTPSLEGLSWRERNALKMRNRGGQGKFVPSKKNPLLARILAMASSTTSSSVSSSSPSSTASTTSVTLQPADEEHHDSIHSVEFDAHASTTATVETISAKATSYHTKKPKMTTPSASKGEVVDVTFVPNTRKRKVPTKTVVESDAESDDPLMLSTASKRKKATHTAKGSKSDSVPASVALGVKKKAAPKGSASVARGRPKKAAAEPSSSTISVDSAPAPVATSRKKQSAASTRKLSKPEDLTTTTNMSANKPSKLASKTSKAVQNFDDGTKTDDSDSDSDVPLGELVSRSHARQGKKSAKAESSTSGKRRTKTAATATAARVPEADEGKDETAAPSQHKGKPKKTRSVEPTAVELSSKTVSSPPSPPPSPPHPQKRKRVEPLEDATASSANATLKVTTKKASSDATAGAPRARNTSRGAAKRTPKTVDIESDSSDEDALVIAVPKRLLTSMAAKSKATNVAKAERVNPTNPSACDSDVKTTSSTARNARPRRVAPAAEESDSDRSSPLPRKRGAKPAPKVDLNVSPAPSKSGEGITLTLPSKKPKRPSFTDIEGSAEVDDMANEVNKNADEVVRILRNVPLPPATSDIEQDEIPRPPMKKGKASSKLKSTKTQTRAAPKPDPLKDTVQRVPLRRNDSSSTLVASSSSSISSTTTKHSVHSTSASAPSQKLKTASRKPSRSKRRWDNDSEPDPLDLFAC